MRADQRLLEHRDDAPLDSLAHHVLPAARLVVDQLPVQADDVDEQALGQPVLAHDTDGLVATLLGEFEVPVAGDVEQTVALHSRDGLTHSRATLAEALCDTRAQRRDALFLKFVHRPQVHLGRVDEVAVVAQDDDLPLMRS